MQHKQQYNTVRQSNGIRKTSRSYTVTGKYPMDVNVVKSKCSVKWVWSKTFICNEWAPSVNGKFITNTAYNRNKGSMK